MRRLRSSLRAPVIAVVACAAIAGLPPSAKSADGVGAGSPVPASSAPAQKPDATAAGGMAAQMQAMQAIHAPVMAAKTPAERAALMHAHMALMQSGMTMMQGMHGTGSMGAMGGMGGMQEGSAQHMDMMQMMMGGMSMPAAGTQ